MERAVELWKILWPDGIPRDAYQKALALAAVAMEEAQKAARRPMLQRGTDEAVTAPGGAVLVLGDVAALARCHPATVRLAINKGQLRASKSGSGRMTRYSIARTDAEAWAAQQNHASGDKIGVPEVAEQAGRSTAGVAYHITTAKTLKAEKSKGRYLVDRADAEAWIKEHKK